MPFTIVRQDIVKMKVDAIVNAANTQLQKGGGVCAAVFEAAGAQELQNACDKIAPIKTGEAAITSGFKLAAKYIIHAAGPVYNAEKAEQSEAYLNSAYMNSLNLALQYKCRSIAFPLISSGIYGYPKDKALQIATSAIRNFLNNYDLDIFLVVFDKNAFEISKNLLGEVSNYIDAHYVKARIAGKRGALDIESKSLNQYSGEDRGAGKRKRQNIKRKFFENPEKEIPDKEIYKNKPFEFLDADAIAATVLSAGVENLIENLDEPFSAILLKMIAKKGWAESEVYKRANMDRRLFSKIRNVKNYMPSKRTALALAIAMELNLAETNTLLKCAGFALSHSQKFDVIVEYFIVNKKYDIFEINEILFKYDQPLLGADSK